MNSNLRPAPLVYGPPVPGPVFGPPVDGPPVLRIGFITVQ